jgi:hypothetical protein
MDKNDATMVSILVSSKFTKGALFALDIAVTVASTVASGNAGKAMPMDFRHGGNKVDVDNLNRTDPLR